MFDLFHNLTIILRGKKIISRIMKKRLMIINEAYRLLVTEVKALKAGNPLFIDFKNKRIF